MAMARNRHGLVLDISRTIDMFGVMACSMKVAEAGTDAARAARLFHALSDETRLGILEQLRSGERCVCELQDTLDAAQSRLSFHLRVLKEAGFVTDRRDGRWFYYKINRQVLDEAATLLNALQAHAPPLVGTPASASCG